MFLGESKSDIRGAGLLDPIKIVFQDLDIEDTAKEKLTGVTTDGENANTGKNGGLWVHLKQYFKKDIFCMWCVAHRSDLVLSDLESTITEVRHWKTNLKAVATFYRGSALCYGWLKKIGDTKKISMYRFPAYFEVRFADHLLNLSKALWKNLPCMQYIGNQLLKALTQQKLKKLLLKDSYVHGKMTVNNNISHVL